MSPEEILLTIMICGRNVNIGRNTEDWQYFMEYVDDSGLRVRYGVGDSCPIRDAYCIIDRRYNELVKREMFGELSDSQKAELEHYNEKIEKLRGDIKWTID